VDVEALGPGDAQKAADAAHLFDHPIDAAALRAFLADPRHHLLIAYVDRQPAGFLTAIELLHPDKPKPEMFLYELGVDEAFRRLERRPPIARRVVDASRTRCCSSGPGWRTDQALSGCSSHRGYEPSTFTEAVYSLNPSRASRNAASVSPTSTSR
jgi:ribosomal protein S18 acetylase RimI-like enzyme